MEVTQETRKHTATCSVRREEKRRTIRERTEKEISAQRDTMSFGLDSQPPLCCSAFHFFYFILSCSLRDTQLSAHFLFLIPTQGSIHPSGHRPFPNSPYCSCFFWLQEGLTLPLHPVAEHIIFPLFCERVSMYLFVNMYTCKLRAYYLSFRWRSRLGWSSNILPFISPWHFWQSVPCLYVSKNHI